MSILSSFSEPPSSLTLAIQARGTDIAWMELLDRAEDGVQVWSGEGALLYANPATYRLFDLLPDDPLMSCADLLSHCLDTSGKPAMAAGLSVCALARAGEGENERVFRIRLDGAQERWLRLRASGLEGDPERGIQDCIISTSFDVTAFVLQEKALLEQAQYDSLTRLPNRVLFADRLHLALATAQRHNEILAVCMLDLDGFKAINDSLGHKAGDRLLQEVAFRLESVLRADDTAARLGGDEFALLIGGLRNHGEGETVLNRILRDLARPIGIDGQNVSVTASIGVSLYPGDVKDPDQLLRHADQAMYKAKEAGKGCFHIFDPALAGKMRASRMLLRKIQEALDEHQFLLYYQPKVDCRLGKVVGFEALVRWQHPVLGLRTPGEFLPLIEQEDAIIGLGEWVIGETLDQIARWEAEGIDLPVSVNIAARQFLRGNFSHRLDGLLARHPPERVARLVIEIVENAVLEDINAVSVLINHFHKAGIRFDLDDFGTGYSSLVHLKRLAADTLKIDQSFVRDMLDDPGDLTIVQGIINLARAFHLSVVAEGVEDIEHALTLLDLGCEVMQGYAIARPMPVDRVAEWVRNFVPDPRWKAAESNFPNRDDFELLLGKVIHRFWQQQVLAAARDPSRATPWPELDETRCRLAIWQADTGIRLFGDRPNFSRYELAHQEVHRMARRLQDTAALAPVDARQLGEFNQACDRLLQSLSGCMRKNR